MNGILDVAGGAPSAPAALAAADLSGLALTRHDTAQADALSARAVQWLDATTAENDARNRIDVWLARAETLFAKGQADAAHTLAQQAVTAAERSDAPTSPQLARARNLLAQHP